MGKRVPAGASERGFALIEILAAAGIWIVLLGAGLYVTQGLFAGARRMTQARTAYVALEHLARTWDAESSTALAIFVPPRDVLGNDNGDGHEVDFYARDAARYGHFWAYRWDASAQTLTRYAYPSPGSSLSSDPPIEGITAFRAVRKPASTLREPFLGGYIPHDVVVNFGYPGVDGGNAVVDVSVANRRNALEVELLPGTMASGFGVVVATFTPVPQSTATPPPAGPAPTAVPTEGPSPGTLGTPAPSDAPTSAPTPTPADTPQVTPLPTLAATAAPATYRTVVSDVCVTQQRQDGGGCVDSTKYLCQELAGTTWSTIATWLDSDHQWQDPPPGWCPG